MKRPHVSELGWFAALGLAGVLLRVYSPVPNFAPVAALALFAGCYFRSRLAAVVLPVVVLAVSDQFLTGYDPKMRSVVYAMLTLPVFLGLGWRHVWSRGESSPLGRGLAIGGTSLASACVFFLVTNFACWGWGSLYEHDLAGLGRCFYRALPFFRTTLLGDLTYTAVLFGGRAWALRWMAARASVPARCDG